MGHFWDGYLAKPGPQTTILPSPQYPFTIFACSILLDFLIVLRLLVIVLGSFGGSAEQTLP